jgi:hypothetical protein
MRDLCSSREKIKRAKEHIRDLDKAIAAFLGTSPYDLTPEFYPQSSATAYFLDKVTDTPPDIPLLIGDAAHNLRTALDHLAVRLFLDNPVNGNASTERIYFPICETLEKYEAEAPRKTKGIPEPLTNAIKALKPYAGGNDRLWGLHRLDIIDKHHLLITTAMVVRQIGFEISPANMREAFKGLFRIPDFPVHTSYFPAPPPISAPEKGALLFAVQGNFEANKNVKFTFDIAFGEPEVFKGKPVLETMLEVSDLVEGIVDSFA